MLKMVEIAFFGSVVRTRAWVLVSEPTADLLPDPGLSALPAHRLRSRSGSVRRRGESRLKHRVSRADSLIKLDPDGDFMNRRSHPRFQTRFDVLCSAGEREGSGTLVNISRSGARLDTSSHIPELGTKVRLYVFIQPVCPFELSGEVVRSDGTTFAIRYSNLDADVGRLVDDVAALVIEP